MKISVISPEDKIYESNDAIEVYIPTQDGIIGIFKDHTNLVSLLGIGSVRIKIKDSKDFESILVGNGIVQIEDNNITILAENADLPANIIKEEIEKAIKIGSERLATETNEHELVMLEKQLRYQKFRQDFVSI